MISSSAAASGSIHGSAFIRKTFFSRSVQWPACEQIERLSRIVMRLPAYASRRSRLRSAVLRSEKPFVLCVPSQNGFLLDPPQRHSATPRIVSQAEPSSRRRFGTAAGCRSFSR